MLVAQADPATMWEGVLQGHEYTGKNHLEPSWKLASTQGPIKDMDDNIQCSIICSDKESQAT